MSAAADAAAAGSAISAAKARLRSELLAARRTAQRNPVSDVQRCAALLRIPELAAARVVAGYVALPGEPDIAGALDALSARGVRVVLPAVRDDRNLEFRERVAGAALVTGRLGVREPRSEAPVVPLGEADVVVVPAVAADRAGHRLGRGGASYDRALRQARPDALVIAVVHDYELLGAVPVEPHDYVVDVVLAGAKVFRAARSEGCAAKSAEV